MSDATIIQLATMAFSAISALGLAWIAMTGRAREKMRDDKMDKIASTSDNIFNLSNGHTAVLLEANRTLSRRLADSSKLPSDELGAIESEKKYQDHLGKLVSIQAKTEEQKE